MTFIEFVKNVNLCGSGMAFIGFVLGMFYYRSLDIVHKGITWYLLSMCLVDVSSRIMAITGNNIIVWFAYSLLEMTMFSYFYFRYLFQARHRLIVGFYLISFLYIIYEIINFERTEMKGLQSYAKVVDDFLIIILVLTFFHEKINIFKESKWDNFRLNAIILVYFSINLVFLLPFNFIINKTSGYQFYFWFGVSISILLFYTYLTHSVWKNGRTQKLSLSGLR
jgi:hypothetical protein